MGAISRALPVVVVHMAAVADLLGRAEKLGASVTYQGSPAAWLLAAAKVAAQGCAVIVNTKGVRADDTPCIITLGELERLRAAAGQPLLSEARSR